ncbi:response regulator [Chitinophaga japonensis]|uniref:LuxR family two component transcriptional regulator n=1 Tax=Chitinophaga japonensis TaxID=104662 RepID=A0A562T2P1_CHIJA|nr:response regulator transcription factor [Chitinophaga japonensis]TWI87905.1 LuxR family two component transcriptional regulator [Chitinophaga japonensis]
MIRVYFVDDHPLVLEGLRSLLRYETDIELVGHTRTGRSCLSFLTQHPADVILMDTILPDISGIDLCAAVKARYPGIIVLGLSFFKEKKYVCGMMDSGASGYVLKNADKEELLRAIHTVHAGKTYLSFDASEAIREETNGAAGRHPHLTRREKEILPLIAEGYTNPEIAEKLFISATTVDSHRKNLLAKLNARNSAMLVKCAIDNKLLV